MQTLYKLTRKRRAFSSTQKLAIAKQIKSISSEELLQDFQRLTTLEKAGDGNRTGNNVVDYFTFPQRLETIGNKHISFFDFWQNKAILKKPYIKSFIKNNYVITPANRAKVYYRVFSLYYGSINVFRPLNAMDIYRRFPCKIAVLDFTMGWGGRLVGACAVQIPKYIGIDSNLSLRKPYENMKLFLESQAKTKIELYFEDALNIDYSSLRYDLVLTSPPYYNLEGYENQKVRSKENWRDEFYIPLFRETFRFLQLGGHYCLNVPEELYTSVCLPLFGECKHIIPLKVRYRSPKYSENVYVWKKD